MKENDVLGPPRDPREAGSKPPYQFQESRSQPGTEAQLVTRADQEKTLIADLDV